jgi:tetratricopeptide (TPR) repeat protein
MESAAHIAPSAEAEVSRLVQLHREGRYSQALDGAEALLREFPGDRDLLLMAAQCLRHLMRVEEALTVLERLEQFHARFSQLHQERGLCHLARNDPARAMTALSQAVTINPSLPVSWHNLKDLYRAADDAGKAMDAERHIATMQGFPPEIVSAASLHADGDVTIAEHIIRTYLQRRGDHPEALRILGKIAMERGLLDEAERLLNSVLARVPDHRSARFDYALALAHQHKYRELDDQARRLLTWDPQNEYFLSLAAVAAMGLGDQQRSAALCRSLLADLPKNAEMLLWLGHALRTAGQIADAIEVYLASISARPGFGSAYWSLANLKTYRFSDAEIAQMRAAECAPQSA